VPFVDHDDMVEQLTSDGPNPSFGEPVLPGRSIRRRLRLDSQALDPIDDLIGEDRVVVVDQESNRVVPGERLAKLLDEPCRRGMSGQSR